MLTMKEGHWIIIEEEEKKGNTETSKLGSSNSVDYTLKVKLCVADGHWSRYDAMVGHES